MVVRGFANWRYLKAELAVFEEALDKAIRQCGNIGSLLIALQTGDVDKSHFLGGRGLRLPWDISSSPAPPTTFPKKKSHSSFSCVGEGEVGQIRVALCSRLSS